MSRVIKFRSWDKDDEVMWDHTRTAEHWWLVLNNGDFAVMQYTGLKDKNGVEVYEEDIVLSLPTVGKGRARVVRYNPNSARYTGIPLTHAYEVIGNIYESYLNE